MSIGIPFGTLPPGPNLRSPMSLGPNLRSPMSLGPNPRSPMSPRTKPAVADGPMAVDGPADRLDVEPDGSGIAATGPDIGPTGPDIEATEPDIWPMETGIEATGPDIGPIESGIGPARTTDDRAAEATSTNEFMAASTPDPLGGPAEAGAVERLDPPEPEQGASPPTDSLRVGSDVSVFAASGAQDDDLEPAVDVDGAVDEMNRR